RASTSPEAPDALQSNSASLESPSRSENLTDASPDTSSKRKRDSITPLESPATKHSKSSHRHAKHWDLEGDLFLRINDCWMRLRRSSLSKHSEWFSDVFAAIVEGRLLADPKRPFVEGTIILVDVKNVQNYCYHVEAFGVTMEDFDVLLDAIDNAISYCHNPPPFPVISAILRAATELKFPMFRDWATQSIQQMWCPSLSSLSTAVIPHASETVILGRAWGVSGVLKRSLYELLRTPSFGQDKNDNFERRSVSTEGQQRHFLLPADILCLVNAREQLDLVWYSATSFEAFSTTSHNQDVLDVSSESTSAPACVPIKYGTYKKLVHDTGLFQTYRFDVLCGLEMLMQIDWESETVDTNNDVHGLCPLCAFKIKEKWAAERERTWEKLEALFGLKATGV
ncbi:hypothetical protein B0H11DRAFT_325965, partial [Mycena galericulata]